MGDYLQFSPSPLPEQAGTLVVSGDWVLENIGAIRTDILTLYKKHRRAELKAEINELDTAGAALLLDLALKLSPVKESEIVSIPGLQEWQESLFTLVAKEDHPTPDIAPDTTDPVTRGLITLGRVSIEAWHSFLDLLRFIGETVVTIGAIIRHPARLRLTSIVRHIRETGLNAVPIIALIAFLISIVLAYQGANQLRRFGAEIFTINMVAMSVLREMGVLLTAIMIAGRSGSAFTAEIGVMQVNEEVDAMRIIGVNPFDILVLPRLIALMITLPVLTFIADIMGLIGGGIISYSLINIGFDQYLDRFREAVGLNDFWVGMIKAPIFAFFIATVGCMRGMQVSGSAESVGRMTTTSVVQSIFLVLLLDALFSILFTKLDM